MTTVTMLIQQCIVILAIFLCHTEAYPKRDYVDCEKFPYHHLCRGMMTKRRFISTDCDINTDPNCPDFRSFFDKLRQNSQSDSDRSRVWLKLLGDALQRDNAYGSYHSKPGTPQENRKFGDAQRQYGDRRISKDFWQEVESPENDY